MNLKERGVTVGDLLLIIIFTISTIFIFNKVKENEKEAHLLLTPNVISYTNIY